MSGGIGGLWLPGPERLLAIAIADRGRPTWHAGTLDATGHITFHDGSPPLRVVDGAVVRLGPVYVVAPTTAPESAYRSAGQVAGSAIVAASADDVADARSAAESARWSYVLATLVLTGAPLLVTAACGLVGR